nr:HEAT repeat domain-containing protein [uncultured Eisenbergiella sp.]
MSDQKELAKIEKSLEKKKSAPIIKLMGKADNDVLAAALEALGKINDEDSANQITHYLEHADAAVRVAACKAALVVDTEYMKTRVRHQLMAESDAQAKLQIQEALNNAKETRV